MSSVRSWEEWSSESWSVPLWTSRTLLVFLSAVSSARLAFWDIDHWGLMHHSCWTTNHLRQKSVTFNFHSCWKQNQRANRKTDSGEAAIPESRWAQLVSPARSLSLSAVEKGMLEASAGMISSSTTDEDSRPRWRANFFSSPSSLKRYWAVCCSPAWSVISTCRVCWPRLDREWMFSKPNQNSPAGQERLTLTLCLTVMQIVWMNILDKSLSPFRLPKPFL